jgi:hypothetical protein
VPRADGFADTLDQAIYTVATFLAGIGFSRDPLFAAVSCEPTAGTPAFPIGAVLRYCERPLAAASDGAQAAGAH